MSMDFDAVDSIRVRGARMHNLQGVDVDLPRDKLIVLTGVSGSGKSSLAFDTIYAEGQRRYIESLSSYARQFLDQLERPDVDRIEGLPPTVAIDQKQGTANPRSTVATVTESYDYLRLLYARAGVPHCPSCGAPIRRQTAEQMISSVLAMQEGKKVLILAPLVKGRKGMHADAFATIRRAKLLRARVDGVMMELLADEDPKLAKTKVHHVEAVVDRLVVREGIRARLAESVDLALKLADGSIILSAEQGDAWVDHVASLHFACPSCGIGLSEIEPRTFSFNSPYGACPKCDGVGIVDDHVCPECQGSKLRAEARGVTLGGKGIHELCLLTATQAGAWLETLRFEHPLDQVGPPLIKEVVARLSFLDRVGLGYLTLDRGANTLSGGELQRVRLATQIGSGLVGVCYVLDEPTAGLHPCDTTRLLDSLRQLRDDGNTVIVVEHDEATIRAADWLVDLGPGAGPEGGQILAEGTLADVIQSPNSITAQYLQDAPKPIPEPTSRLATSPGRLTLLGASEHNLKGDTVVFPIGCLTVISGVSGSGKSTLVLEILARAINLSLGILAPKPGKYEAIECLEQIDKLIEIDQSPIGRGPRSTPATFTGVYDEIRKVYALTKDAKIRGYKPNRFSFNVKGGRCEVCEGQGQRKIAMQFLPDLYVKCEACGGLRFNRQTLEARFGGKSIGELLLMRVDEVRDRWAAIPKVRAGLDALHEAGLGYVTLGQSSTTLSGGEAQRVKLAAELGRVATGRTLYILDEPTTGLHFVDVARLLGVLNRLVDLGNTVLVIEHSLDLIRAADWVVDLGPGGGPDGGHVVAMGPPSQVAKVPGSATGYALRVDAGRGGG